MAWKFLMLQREDRWEPGDSLVSRIVRATLRRLTVIARNPIYQAFLRPSSMLCTASLTVFLYTTPRAFPSRANGDTGNCRRPVWDSYSVAWFTWLTYQKWSQTSTLLLPILHDGYYRFAFLSFIPLFMILNTMTRKFSCMRRIVT